MEDSHSCKWVDPMSSGQVRLDLREHVLRTLGPPEAGG